MGFIGLAFVYFVFVSGGVLGFEGCCFVFGDLNFCEWVLIVISLQVGC